MAKYQELSPKALGVAMAIVGFIMSLFGFGGGMMGYPMMGYTNTAYLWTVVAMVVGGYVIGWLLAHFYNWALKRK